MTKEQFNSAFLVLLLVSRQTKSQLLQPLGIVPRKPRKIVPIAVALLQLLAQVLEADVVKDHANGRSRGYHNAPLSFKALAEPGIDGVLAFSLGASVVAGFLATEEGRRAAASWRCCLLFSGFLPDDGALRGFAWKAPSK